jgi:hypothetical protein
VQARDILIRTADIVEAGDDRPLWTIIERQANAYNSDLNGAIAEARVCDHMQVQNCAEVVELIASWSDADVATMLRTVAGCA